MDSDPQPGPSSSSSCNKSDDQKLAELLSGGGGFAVYPLPWCPHLQGLPSEDSLPETVNTAAPCQNCGDARENWLCLHCFQINCSRYINEHQLSHYFCNLSHPLALSFSDLSVWCFECDSYVDNQQLYPVKNKAHMDKFQGEEMVMPDYSGTTSLLLESA